MLLNRFLIIGLNSSGKASARLSVNSPALDADEIAVYVTVNIPDELFQKPSLTARIDVPEDAVSAPVIDTEVTNNIQQVVSRELGIDLQISVPEVEHGH